MQSAAVDAVMPIFRSAVEGAEEAIVRMHAVNFAQAGEPSVVMPSPYMADLVKLLSHVR